jgi:uncharacterized repeat protein (TIGR02543 family)
VRGSWARAATLLLTLILPFAVGVGGSSARPLAPTAATQVLIQVIGVGKVTGSGFDCGTAASETCYATVTSDATLTPVPTDVNWGFVGWSGDCDLVAANDCTITANGSAHEVTATFSTTGATATHTLSVGVPGTTPGGKVMGGSINCGSGPSTACTWEVLSGSTLTVLETPDAGYSFNGWGGACSGTQRSCTVTMTSDRSVVASFASTSTDTKLTVTVVGNGTVTGGGITCGSGSTCQSPEPPGSFVTLTATAASGYIFTGWSGTGTCSGSSTTCTIQMTESKMVTATFQLTYTLSLSVAGNGNVTSNTGGINCGTIGAVCSASIAAGTSVTLTATGTTGGTFTSWGGACSGTTTTCTVLMDSAKSVSAIFSGATTGQTFPLTVSVTGSGTVSGGGINCGTNGSVCSVSLATGTSVTLTETPASGATFTGWGGACSGTATTCTVAMSVARSVTAAFTTTSTETFRLSVSVTGSGRVTGPLIACGNGFTTCFANEPANATVTLTAAPATGATFQSWGGACSGASTTCQIQMNAAKSVTATFTKAGAKAALTLKVVGKGTVATSAGKCSSTGAAKTCIQSFAVGTNATLTATPGKGAAFRGWGGACKGLSKSCQVQMSAAKSVTATFTKPKTRARRATLTLKVAGKGAVATPAGKCASSGKPKTCRQAFALGRKVTLKATPSKGAAFQGWSGQCTGKRPTCTVTLSRSRSVSARFSS